MPQTASHWKVAGASVTGFSHEAKGKGCDDNHSIVCHPDGWLIAIVADGAGSAVFGARGSRLTVELVGGHLAALCDGKSVSAEQIDSAMDGMRAGVIEAVDQLRLRLIDEAREINALVSDFHTTLVGYVGCPSGRGLFFHIGDGAAYAQNPSESDEYVLSLPENGEFAESTYFVTEDDWQSHLRFVDVPSSCRQVALMSDGVTAFALSSGPSPAPFGPFWEPVTRFLRDTSRAVGEDALAATLMADRIRAITGDDKTLVWLLRRDDDD